MVSCRWRGNDIGYVTSPWWSPELETNITHLHGYTCHGLHQIGTKLLVRLPDEYSVNSGEPVEAEVVGVPFRESVNPNKREVEAAKGKDFAE